METLLAVGMGGFLGANARFIISGWLSRRIAAALHISLPLGTLFVNVTGSCLLAIFLVWSSHRIDLPQSLRLLIGTGFFGAYTTFSTFANDSINLLQQGKWAAGVGNILVTNLLCVVGVLLGLAIASRLWSAA